MTTIRTETLVYVIRKRFEKTANGHCARVDFMSREEARAVCAYIQQHANAYPFVARMLVSASTADTDAGTELTLTTDQAIEQRNLKQHSLCLFVPSEMVDAAVSSLGNSFAPIDGREVLVKARERIERALSASTAQIARAVFSQLRGVMKAGEEQRLDFVCTLHELEQAGQVECAGRELWRVGLIADARATFVERLENNRRCARELKHPFKMHATTGERLHNIMVDAPTTSALLRFFRGRTLSDVRDWSRALAAGEGPTFDQWVFPDVIPSDIRSVEITPFLDKRGAVLTKTKLAQPGGPGTSLIAYYGEKGAVAVQWTTEPKDPQNLSRWQVAIVPSGVDDADSESDVELPAREIAGHRRSLTLKLDMELEEPPDFGVRVRVTPLDSSGSPIKSNETGDKVHAESEEFALLPEGDREIGTPTRDSRQTVPTLAYGRIAAIVEKNMETLSESEPLWSEGQDYFRIKLNDKHTLTIGVSRVLVELERHVLQEPQQGGRFCLTVHEVAQTSASAFEPLPIEHGEPETDAWDAFWRERERFFKPLQKSDAPRNLVETADWTEDLAKAALKYARSYQSLLDSLCAEGKASNRAALMEALSVDTALIRLKFAENNTEEALLILPTHPLRLAWIARYTSILRGWEADLLALKKSERKRALELETLQMLTPSNMPAFAYHPEAAEPGVFFQNLHLYHGVAFAAETPDPHRRLSDLATVLGAQISDNPSFRLQPERLAEHISNFIDLHPYVQTLAVNLVNPDRGDLLAAALQLVIKPDNNQPDDDDEGTSPPPMFHITSYVADTRKSRGESLERLRLLNPSAHTYTADTDYLLPNLSTTLRQIPDDQTTPVLEDAHIAIGTDLTRPRVVAVPKSGPLSPTMSSFAFDGLVCRFMLSFASGQDGLSWRYYIVSPEAAKKDELTALHTALLHAGGRWLKPAEASIPALDVAMDSVHQRLLERMHEKATWVVTLDRFFVLDYYDSPCDPALHDIAQKYVLDYAPELVEGPGHRLMVTTSWHDEIGAMLEQAMHELGFVEVDRSVRNLLHYLKLISGRLVLQAFESNSSAAAAVGMGVVTAWLQQKGRLANAVLVPIDPHPRIFQQGGKASAGERRCDMMLVSLKRDIVEMTFIEVKWRRGRAPIEELAQDMRLQMEGTARMIQDRFFNPERLDGALQRSHLAHVLRFYLKRAQRYQLIASDKAQTFMEHLGKLEKDNLDFRPSYEGYVVSLESQPRASLSVGDARITLLTAEDFPEPWSGGDGRQGVPDPASGNGGGQAGVPAPVASTAPVSTLPPQPAQPAVSERTQQQEATQPAVSQPTGTLPAVADAREDIIVPLGETAGREITWQPGVKGNPHLFILGIPGQGKSWAVTRMLTELGQQHIPALVLDFHGQFADPAGTFVQRVSPVVLDAAKGLPFSPFECTLNEGNDGWIANAYGLAEIFGYVAGLGDMQRDLVFTAIRDAYHACGFGEEPDEAPELPTLNAVLRLIEARERSNRTSNVTARCRPLLEMDLFRPDGQDFGTLLQQGVVIDLHNLYVETLQMAAGAFVLRKVYKDMFRWGPTERLRLAIVLDEAHRLARDVTLPKIMKEGRKFGVAVIVASQGLSDFHPDIVSNVGTKVVFRVNYPESRKTAGFIRARQGQDLSARLEQLSVGTAYVQTPEMPYGAVVQMYPPGPA